MISLYSSFFNGVFLGFLHYNMLFLSVLPLLLLPKNYIILCNLMFISNIIMAFMELVRWLGPKDGGVSKNQRKQKENEFLLDSWPSSFHPACTPYVNRFIPLCTSHAVPSQSCRGLTF